MENNREIGATIMVLILAAFCFISWIKQVIAARRKMKILKEGIAAQARVLHIIPTGVYLNNLPEFQVQVQVRQASGDDFVARTTEVLPYADYDAIRKKQEVTVKYDKASCSRIILYHIEKTGRIEAGPYNPIAPA
ncbi:hypothetical protein [Dyadobacter sandarakinus]|uniref:DUF3592 domain-containing protein n=1 Tax=Dyadobacter sandarakinus TaxID=2747268 RepID=A0ABX7I7G0_9BACT|nr:hypothetical protein [Dyadobacter sandarakinus]QRR01113.1 hypothetical protein HWI92_09450 [Dyadobacter sandarakinus]